MFRRSLPWFGMIAVLLLLPLPVRAADLEQRAATEAAAADSGPSVASKIFDCAVLRPFGLAGVIIGGALFVPTAALASSSGSKNIQAAWEHFVVAQVENTFKRPLGDF
jgi:hypothetical protein